MNAEEMFKELGYVKLAERKFVSYSKDKSKYVDFYITDHDYTTANVIINVNIHLAITQQMKELGWIEQPTKKEKII